jgi:nucleotide-binding universal stress UspA family protein
MNNATTHSNLAEPSTGGPPYRVVVGSDFSALGDRALVEGMRLCSLYPHAELHVITVGSESRTEVRLPGSALEARPKDEAQALVLAHIARQSERYFAGRPCVGLEKIAVYVAVGSPAERIVALASGIDADVIVLGTHSRHGLERWVLGSVADEVMRRAPCGVFVVRPRDFLDGEKLPEIQPPLRPGEHPLQPFRESVTYHYVDRLTQGTTRIMPAI